jgi:ribonucleases P/MRP protein subunit RPP40
LHGKKGFDRLVYACKNALNTPKTWLFCNVSKDGKCFAVLYLSLIYKTITDMKAPAPNPDPLVQHFPTEYTSNPVLVQNMEMNTPPLKIPSAVLSDRNRTELDEYATEIYEWLSLVRLESPRLETSDTIDPYLSTYVVPGNPLEQERGRLCKISWRGFISSRWVADTLAVLINTLPQKTWFSISTTPFTRVAVGHGADCTIMRPPSSPGEYVLWEIKGHE